MANKAIPIGKQLSRVFGPQAIGYASSLNRGKVEIYARAPLSAKEQRRIERALKKIDPNRGLRIMVIGDIRPQGIS